MKKYFNIQKIISILAMSIGIILVSACTKEIDSTKNSSGSTTGNTTGTTGNGSGSTANGSVVFWFDSDLMGGNIKVTINGSTNYISTSYTTSPTCGASGCANFTLPIGSYTYTASSNNDTWSDTVNSTSNGCSKIKLTSNSSGSTGNGGGATINMDLNGKWINDGNGIQISGSSATFYSFGGNWQTANSKGIVSIGTIKLKNIYTTSTANSWTCQELYMTTTNNVIDGTTWSSDGKISMNSDGKSITLQSTGPISGNPYSNIYTRVN
jgi:hypothetical protein